MATTISPADMSLFQPFVLRSGTTEVTMRNRIMRSATWEGLADATGHVTDVLIEKMVELAKGNVGLIIASYAYVSQDGQTGVGQIGVYDDSHIAGLRRMTDAVHASGGHIALQINHGGRVSMSSPSIGPCDCEIKSENPDKPVAPNCIAADTATMARILNNFVNAARRVKAAGFDAVMLHMAHGFLLSQWLSPLFNQRTDEHGGSIENRLKWVLEIVAAVRAEVGPNYPILAKLNTADFHSQGLTVEESTVVAVALAKAGVCLLEASGGTSMSSFASCRTVAQGKEGHHATGSTSWKQALSHAGLSSTAVALVGGIRSPKSAQEFISGGSCDIISLARPFIREPTLVLRWQSDPENARSACVSCNKCFGPIRSSTGFYCPLKGKNLF
ncbi:NADH:flavin oxidoreductase [Pelomyxa schiedti]|nr:NADH:flavin oxidoreductase [Pelomyxa schiedti]